MRFILTSKHWDDPVTFNSLKKAQEYAEWVADCQILWQENDGLWIDVISDQDFKLWSEEAFNQALERTKKVLSRAATHRVINFRGLPC